MRRTWLLVCAAAACAAGARAVVQKSTKLNDVGKLQNKPAGATGAGAAGAGAGAAGCLYPQAGPTRDVRSLDGIWNFRLSPPDPEVGTREGWFEQDLFLTGPVIPMPVPASYNDVGEDAAVRDHVGLVWYDRRFSVPSAWLTTGQKIWLRFGSVHYAAQVWVNGKPVVYHEVGHLPFEAEVAALLQANSSNLLTVAVDNTLFDDTVPQGTVHELQYDGKTKLKQTYTFDFFNYAGIHRSVVLHATPPHHIDDVIVNTDIQGLTGFIVYNVTHRGGGEGGAAHCAVQLFDRERALVSVQLECAGLIEVANANLWWPHLMHPEPGYLYTLKVSLLGAGEQLLDTYKVKVGIRTVSWTNTTLFLNHRPVYLRGFGMHEDSDFRGKGWDAALWVKNFNLIRWTGANAFRTSHYPYAEEIYRLADEQGVMVIDECPSVNTEFFSDVLLAKHKQTLTELIRRDKNHPSVIMWSIANEPRTASAAADKYFEQVAEHVRSMDVSRPITAALAVTLDKDKIAQHLDVISFNRYNGWYAGAGELGGVTGAVAAEAAAWHRRHNRPVLMSEYGADTVAGMHFTPSYIWSEEYQVDLMSRHFEAFDRLRKKGFFVGEFIWNFADFKTEQTTTRAGGNKKGIFTRNRQPKASAHHLRARYHALAAADDDAAPVAPPYVADGLAFTHDEF